MPDSTHLFDVNQAISSVREQLDWAICSSIPDDPKQWRWGLFEFAKCLAEMPATQKAWSITGGVDEIVNAVVDSWIAAAEPHPSASKRDILGILDWELRCRLDPDRPWAVALSVALDEVHASAYRPDGFPLSPLAELARDRLRKIAQAHPLATDFDRYFGCFVATWSLSARNGKFMLPQGKIAHDMAGFGIVASPMMVRRKIRAFMDSRALERLDEKIELKSGHVGFLYVLGKLA